MNLNLFLNVKLSFIHMKKRFEKMKHTILYRQEMCVNKFNNKFKKKVKDALTFSDNMHLTKSILLYK